MATDNSTVSGRWPPGFAGDAFRQVLPEHAILVLTNIDPWPWGFVARLDGSPDELAASGLVDPEHLRFTVRGKTQSRRDVRGDRTTVTRRAGGRLTVERQIWADMDDGELFAAFDDAWSRDDGREIFELVCRLLAITCSVASKEVLAVPRIGLIARHGGMLH